MDNKEIFEIARIINCLVDEKNNICLIKRIYVDHDRCIVIECHGSKAFAALERLNLPCTIVKHHIQRIKWLEFIFHTNADSCEPLARVHVHIIREKYKII